MFSGRAQTRHFGETVVLGLAVLALLSIGAARGLAWGADDLEDAKVVTAEFINAMKSLDMDRVKELCTQRFLKEHEEDFQDMEDPEVRANMEEMLQNMTYEITGAEAVEGGIKISFTMTVEGEASEAWVILVQEDGAWKVDQTNEDVEEEF